MNVIEGFEIFFSVFYRIVKISFQHLYIHDVPNAAPVMRDYISITNFLTVKINVIIRPRDGNKIRITVCFHVRPSVWFCADY